QAGGPNEDAGGIIQVFRTQPPMCSDISDIDNWATGGSAKSDVPSRIYSYSSLTLGTEGSNPTIYPGDVIVVLKAKPVYITGEVVAPQGIYIKEGGLSLTEAIGKVSGLGHDAQAKSIKIYRMKPDSKDRIEITANLDLIRKMQQKDIML